MSKQLVEWFRASLAKGCDPKELKSLAIKAGHSPAEVNRSYSAARRVTGQVSLPSAFPMHLLALGAVLVLGLLASYYVLFMLPPSMPSEGFGDPASVGQIAFGKAGFKSAESIVPMVVFGAVLLALIALLYYRLYVHPIPGMPPGP